MVADANSDACTHCGATQNDKLVSRFQRLRTEDDRLDAMADEVERIGEPESPSQMRELMREMGKATDEDFSDEMEEVFETDMAGGFEDE